LCLLGRCFLLSSYYFGDRVWYFCPCWPETDPPDLSFLMKWQVCHCTQPLVKMRVGGVSKTFPAWLQIMVLPMLAFQLSRIAGVSHHAWLKIMF
jgi:hypothetical protein